MSTLSELGAKIGKYIKDSAKMKSLDKEDFRTILVTNISAHKILDNAFKNLTPKERESIYNNYTKAAKDSKLKSKNIPMELVGRYSAGAKKKENTKAFGALLEANKKFIDIQEELLKNLDNLVVESAITIFNIRLSHVALLGILRQSEMFGTYLGYYWAQISVILSNIDESTIPGYRTAYLIKNRDNIVEIVNMICEKEGRYSFLAEIDNIKKKNSNLLLYSAGQTIDRFIKPNALNRNVSTTVYFGSFMLDIFVWIGSVRDDFKHYKHIKDVNLKEWAEAHVANLKYSLAEKDPNSPEAIKLANIIKAYDDEIAKVDERINKYLTED